MYAVFEERKKPEAEVYPTQCEHAMSADACRNWAEKSVLKSPPLRSLQMSALGQKLMRSADLNVCLVPLADVTFTGIRYVESRSSPAP